MERVKIVSTLLINRLESCLCAEPQIDAQIRHPGDGVALHRGIKPSHQYLEVQLGISSGATGECGEGEKVVSVSQTQAKVRLAD